MPRPARQLGAHRRKLREFEADPAAHDHTGILAELARAPRQNHWRTDPKAAKADRELQKAARAMRKAAPQPVTEIDLVKLRAIANRLLDHIIETRGVRTLVVETPYYWEVPAPERYHIEADPGELQVGNLVDDWEFVSGLLQASDPPIAYQLTELAVLEYVGQRLAEELGQSGG